MDRNDREVMQQALDALEAFGYHGRSEIWTQTITALRARLAEPEPEPVVWRDPSNSNPGQGCTYDKATHEQWPHIFSQPLYAGPFSRRPLTDEEILRLWSGDVPRPVIGRNKVLSFARAIERKITGGNDE